jgi:hypothetical protein
MNQRSLLMSGLILAISLALVGLARSPLTAQQADPSDLAKRVAELERRIERLESLFKEGGEARTEGIPSAYGWQNKKNWRRLRVGMTEDEVKASLGEPTKIITGVRTLWYYPNIYCGYVSFDNDGQLTGWNEP